MKNNISINKSLKVILLSYTFLLLVISCAENPKIYHEKWTEQEINVWYAEKDWKSGANFVPSSSINQLEMWQEDTFDPTRIDEELGWAQDLGMNTMRVYLHDLLHKNDAPAFRANR